MLNSRNNQKVVPIYAKETKATSINTQRITSIMNEIKNKNSNYKLNNAKLTILHSTMEQIIENFNTTYRELVTTEIKIMNLNIAAEAINSRDNLVDNIYDTVMREIEHQAYQ